MFRRDNAARRSWPRHKPLSIAYNAPAARSRYDGGMIRKSEILAWLLFAALVPGATAAADKPPPAGRDHRFDGKEGERAERIQKEFQDAGRELAETHARALREPELQPALERLRQSMEKAMIRLEPQKKDQILRRYAVHREMIGIEKIEAPSQLDKERYQSLLLDFTNLSEALGDLPKRAAEEADVKAERAKFHTALLGVMTRLDPKVPELMQQQKKSVAEYGDLESELLKKHGAVAPPTPHP